MPQVQRNSLRYRQDTDNARLVSESSLTISRSCRINTYKAYFQPFLPFPIFCAPRARGEPLIRPVCTHLRSSRDSRVDLYLTRRSNESDGIGQALASTRMDFLVTSEPITRLSRKSYPMKSDLDQYDAINDVLGVAVEEEVRSNLNAVDQKPSEAKIGRAKVLGFLA